jgi:periplasmic copper chaperone A
MVMKKFFFCCAIIVNVLLEHQAAAQDIMIMNPVAAPSLTSATKTGAVYLSIMNMSKDSDQLIGISTPAAESAMLHKSKDENGVMKMEMLDQLEIPAGVTIDILPGHMHIMLMGLKSQLKIGDHVPLDLVFKKTGKVSVDAVVGKIDDMATMKHTN